MNPPNRRSLQSLTVLPLTRKMCQMAGLLDGNKFGWMWEGKRSSHFSGDAEIDNAPGLVCYSIPGPHRYYCNECRTYVEFSISL